MAAGGADIPTYRGEIRTPGGEAVAGRVTLDEAAVILGRDGSPPRTLAYRDLAVLAIADGVGLVATGTAPEDERWLLGKMGAALGPVITALRERRLRQRLDDAFVALPPGEPVELVEYAVVGASAAGGGDPGSAEERGVAQLAIDGWGATLAPLDERRPVRRLRRAEIGAVDALPQAGGVRIAAPGEELRLLRLGAAAARHRDRLLDLPAAAHRDAGAIVASLVPDLPAAAAGRAAAALVDGRPATRADLGDAWDALERSVLREPAFAASYATLRERAGGASSSRWLAIAPERPGEPDGHRAWFLVALPGNLVALELVSAGAHATYCFRTVPRAEHARRGDPAGIDPAAAAAAVSRLSAALVDARFLREPIALPAEQLTTPEGTRYRLALRAIPSLAAARRDFVARLVHRSEESWTAALDDLVAWHGSCADDAAAWPGRSAQEAQVAAALG
jgi:hypothetical protein